MQPIAADAIRFYERLGLIKPKRGQEGRHGYRRYDTTAVRRPASSFIQRVATSTTGRGVVSGWISQ
ncbi:MAG: MerR family transcriptional regulator [Rhodocyclaceae bacterium]|nr:MAG: MerR family transcriptional regulator [Rhodocyclaceae bacterium]